MLPISGLSQYRAGASGITMPLGIGCELCGLTPCADPVCGTLLGSNLIGEVRLLGITIPLRIGCEVCGFAPCSDPVCGTLLGSVVNAVLGGRPLFRMTMPLGIGSELCGFKPCADPVCGSAAVSVGCCGRAQPLMASATPPITTSLGRI